MTRDPDMPSPGSGAEGPHPDINDQFARMLREEGVRLAPGDAPREFADAQRAAFPTTHSPARGFSADSPVEPTAEDRARARAAHPSAQRHHAPGHHAGAPWRGSTRHPELDDDDVLYGDFTAPDPDLPAPSGVFLWSWVAALGGFALLLFSVISSTIPGWLGALGAVAAIGGVIALLAQAPTRRGGSDDGAEV